jgi:GNAT superfamily N-acetyltransferase
MDNLRIEPATLDDLPELTEMLFELFSQEQDFVPDREKQARGLRLVLEDPSRGRIFVLRSPGKIIGMINLLITISTAEGSFVMWLEDMFIHREHRGQGYGTRLLNHAIEFAKNKNFLRITLLTDQPDEHQKNFYLKNGFVLSSMVPMRLYLHTDAH